MVDYSFHINVCLPQRGRGCAGQAALLMSERLSLCSNISVLPVLLTLRWAEREASACRASWSIRLPSPISPLDEGGIKTNLLKEFGDHSAEAEDW